MGVKFFISLKHIKELDSIRAIAALSVMFLHIIPMFQSSNKFIIYFKSIHSIFQFGVPIFFVLSGFLISRILLNGKDEKKYFTNFYIKRTLRIFPLYYLICVVVFLGIPIFNNQITQINLKGILPNIFYLQNIFIAFHIPYIGPNHFWSLAVEEHFYFIWPFLIFYFNLRRLKKIIIVILVLQPIFRFVLANKGIDVYYFTFTRLDEILYGCLLAILEKEGKILSYMHLAILGLLSSLSFILFVKFSGSSNLIIQALKYSFWGYAFFVLIGIVALNRKSSIVLKNNFLAYSGKISYGLYMYHPFVFGYILLFNPNYNPILFFFLCFIITYLIASLSYYLFELKFLKLKQFLIVN